MDKEFCDIPVVFRIKGELISGECPDYPSARQLIKRLAKKGSFNMYEKKGKLYFSFKLMLGENPK